MSVALMLKMSEYEQVATVYVTSFSSQRSDATMTTVTKKAAQEVQR